MSVKTWTDAFLAEMDLSPRLHGATGAREGGKAKIIQEAKNGYKDASPFFMVHGDKDPPVVRGQSVVLHQAQQNAGVPVTLYAVKGDK